MPKPTLAAAIAFRSAETVAAEVAGLAALEWVSREAIPDVPLGFRKEDADPAQMALKRKADEGFLQNPTTRRPGTIGLRRTRRRRSNSTDGRILTGNIR